LKQNLYNLSQTPCLFNNFVVKFDSINEICVRTGYGKGFDEKFLTSNINPNDSLSIWYLNELDLLTVENSEVACKELDKIRLVIDNKHSEITNLMQRVDKWSDLAQHRADDLYKDIEEWKQKYMTEITKKICCLQDKMEILDVFYTDP